MGIFDINQGLLYTGDANFLGIQLVGAIAYSLWALLLSYIFFFSLKQNDRLRCKSIYEIIGQDFRRSHNFTMKISRN